MTQRPSDIQCSLVIERRHQLNLETTLALKDHSHQHQPMGNTSMVCVSTTACLLAMPTTVVIFQKVDKSRGGKCRHCLYTQENSRVLSSCCFLYEQPVLAKSVSLQGNNVVKCLESTLARKCVKRILFYMMQMMLECVSKLHHVKTLTYKVFCLYLALHPCVM